MAFWADRGFVVRAGVGRGGPEGCVKWGGGRVVVHGDQTVSDTVSDPSRE